MKLTRRELLLGAAGVPSLTRAANAPVRIGVALPRRMHRTLVAGKDWDIAVEAAERGALLGEEEHAFNAGLLGTDLQVLFAATPTAEVAARAARRLIAADEVCAIVGGFAEDQAWALAAVCEQARVPFLNIGTPADDLRSAKCHRFTFHVEASDAMYLDALLGCYTRRGVHQWHVVQQRAPRGDALYSRFCQTLARNRDSARPDRSILEPNYPQFDAALEDIAASKAQGVMLLLPWLVQLDFLRRYEVAGLGLPVAAATDPVSQTREYFATLREAAPRAATGPRVALWEATLEAYGARSLNERFELRWGIPMDGAAWAAYHAIKIVSEAASAAGAADGSKIAAYLEHPDSVFDVSKGVAVSFRSWDHQLRQPLFLVRLVPEAKRGSQLAVLEEELPARTLGSEPAARLDAIGATAHSAECRHAAPAAERR